MKIAAKEFKIMDLTDTGEINRFLEKIQLNDDTEITIDISACLISYDTSEFIDKILERIHNAGKPKKLIIYTDYRFLTEDSLYDFLFQKSRVLDNHDKKNSYTEGSKDAILQQINADFNIEFKVEMPNG
jgi:hypothetical protein